MDYELLFTPSGLIEMTVCSLADNITADTVLTGIVNQYGAVVQDGLPVQNDYTYVIDVGRGPWDMQAYPGGYLYMTSDHNVTWYRGPETSAPTMLPTPTPTSLPTQSLTFKPTSYPTVSPTPCLLYTF